MQTEHLPIQKHRLIEILNDETLYQGGKLNLDQTSHNARQIIAALAGMLSYEHEDIANLLAARIGLAPTAHTLTAEQVPA